MMEPPIGARRRATKSALAVAAAALLWLDPGLGRAQTGADGDDPSPPPSTDPVPTAPLSSPWPPPAPPLLPLAPASPSATPDQTRPAPEAASPPAPEEQTPPVQPASDQPAYEQTGEVIEIVDRTTPGSVQTIGLAELERFEYDDVHQVLGAVAGVYIREEDGYGLRPNIGMRGSGSERSAKITLMEDGVLIAPAPYSAPAAYYFPLVTRMQRVDVLKGPAAIQYGPNTVGGAVDMISKPVPRTSGGELDLAAGRHLYSKAHLSYAYALERVAFMLEGVNLRSNGFKELDTGGSTGFLKNDVQLKVRVDNDTRSRVYQALHLKLGYADEGSNETYVGLADGDFQATPYRRYAATQLDRMEWRHLRAQLDYQLELGPASKVWVTAYRNQFDRDWKKLDGFNVDRSLASILANPSAGNNAVFYAILQGQADSTSDAEMLVLGTNSRHFISQGVQARGTLVRHGLGARHTVDMGLRLHHDQARRQRFEDGYWMAGGLLEESGMATLATGDTLGSTVALAGYARDEVRIGRVSVTAGLRTEVIHSAFEDQEEPDIRTSDTYAVFIPGAGAVYRASASLDLLAGVHRGFVPVAPGQNEDVSPESSINYEAGARYADMMRSFELIGFFSDYSNLKGTCTFSSGCMDQQVGDEFNGGSVHVLGIEAMATWNVRLARGLAAPLHANYTYNRSRFQESFSSSNPQWGDVRVGDALPYLPEHQLSVRAGLAGGRWEVATSLRYVSAMRDVAGQGNTPDDERISGYAVVNLAANHDFGRLGTLYLTMDNILGQAYMVSMRPVGARPGKPRLFILGYKNQF